jgi:protein-S-isoprenylcysteine O-methyltransferase Ste14
MVKGILLFITGVSLFLYGMIRLSTEVQQRFSDVRIREYFQLAVKNPIYGLITGIVTTVLFQSSTATSVLTVGMVSAGLMSRYRDNFYRSIGGLEDYRCSAGFHHDRRSFVVFREGEMEGVW